MAHGTHTSAPGAHLDEVYQLLPIAPVRGDGVWLVEASGRRILDLYGGHAVAVLGYAIRGSSRRSPTRPRAWFSRAMP
jgi:acetylornithine/succinyldiaminopimelate/putrescine aminotransferase